MSENGLHFFGMTMRQHPDFTISQNGGNTKSGGVLKPEPALRATANPGKCQARNGKPKTQKICPFLPGVLAAMGLLVVMPPAFLSG